MSGKKDQAVVFVIDKLTAIQAGRLKGAISAQKSKIAPNARGMAFSGDRTKIGKNLTASTQKLLTNPKDKKWLGGYDGKTIIRAYKSST